MSNSKPKNNARETKVPSLGLKHKNQKELLENLIRMGGEWSEQSRQSVFSAYELVERLHRDDRHRDNPYVYHLLRVANRIPGYLHIYDPEIVTAALLHDSVEDHPGAIVKTVRQETELTKNQKVLQQHALDCLSTLFSKRVADTVSAVTNPVALQDPELSYEDKMSVYVDKVTQAVRTPEGWMVKFSDWCDNGVGVEHGSDSTSDQRMEHFRHKYGLVTSIFQERAAMDDIQALLDEDAAVYVEQQFRLAEERLT